MNQATDTGAAGAQAGSFSCYLVGTESLLIQCARALLSRGHAVRGVVTADAQIRAWAEEHRVPVIDPRGDLVEVLGREPFDYLFSIANLTVLPGALLRLPRRAAINFHDGPLPRYAGLHATSWALLHGERRHGVTWHLMLEQVDAGDIVGARPVEIAEGETALTLNAKCYEAGMVSFVELIDALADGRAARRPQDGPRSYFGRYQRPAAAAVLDWRRPAAELAALVRALDFGPYKNPLCCAKLLLPDEAFVVARAEAAAAEASGPAHAPPPGTVLALGGGVLRVATGAGDLRVTQLRTVDGQPVEIDALPGRGVRAGDRLPLLSIEAGEQLGVRCEALARSESFWSRRLASLDPLAPPELAPAGAPAPAASTAGAPASDWIEVPIEAPAPLPGFAGAPAELTLLAAAACLGRLGDRDRFDVALRAPAIREATGGFEPCFVGHVPLRVELPEAGTLLDVGAAFCAELAEVCRRGSYARDLVARTPALAAELPQRGPLRVAFELDPDEAPAPAGCALVLRVGRDGGGCLRLDRRALQPGEDGAALLQLPRRMAALLRGAAAEPARPLGELGLLDERERRRVLEEWQGGARPAPPEPCVHRAFEAQARRSPDRVALVFEEREITYAALNARANQLARSLRGLGVTDGTLVGVCVERSLEMVLAILAVHKAGGAYVPLDPAYPKERLAFMMEDAGLGALLTQASLADALPPPRCPRLCVDPGGADWAAVSRQADGDLEGGAREGGLAYVIYTSGSTGKPKGVMVEHRNVLNFFAGMDAHLGVDGASAGGGASPGVWLAVTSLSFDISVLELLWTLCRGFKVVIQRDTGQELSPAARPARSRRAPARPLDFSLFYFASDEGGAGALEKYQLLLDGARFADRHGFVALWTPERHFHAFGGLYPNPSVVSAALAAVTERVRLRAGSVVLPLHDPIRVAEEWAVVDNLSRGRVDISFAAGWQPNDFVLAPGNFADRKRLMMDGIETVRALWRGETIRRPGPDGKEVALRTLPRPVQPELPVWLTAAGNPETFRMAAEIGAGVLTHLLGQSFEELADKCALYRRAWRESGRPGRGHVTLMLHSFVGPDLDEVKRLVREPMKGYLRSAVGLVKEAAWSFPTFQQRADSTGRTPAQLLDEESLSPEEMDALLGHAFDRYFDRSGLFGTPETCQAILDRARDADVDELGCLIDYGVPAEIVLRHLPYLAQAKERAAAQASAAQGEGVADYSIGAQLRRHGVTHLQCTPSMMSIILLDDGARAALGGLRTLLLGGEALPPPLVAELRGVLRGELLNVYGPTETTVWSAAGRVDLEGAGPVPIGRPLANQQIYLLDRRRQPVPSGAAGEIYVGGAGVVRGYLGRPELNGERFVPSPFRPGARLYRTGDLARHLPDGRLLFLGRADHQVKIRGHRIELGEIEAALCDAPEVAEAVCVARDDGGGPALCAYVTARPGHAVDAKALREALARRLPAYMVPAHVVPLAAMPLTPNAKIDRRALLAPSAAPAAVRSAASALAAGATPAAPPSSELERQIAAIWQDVLGQPQVGLDDNFFDLGGHSLLTVQAHRRLREATGKDLAITDLFRFPTIRALAAFLGGAGGDEALLRSDERAEARREALGRRQQQLQRRRGREGDA